jgi:hypothetical protein
VRTLSFKQTVQLNNKIETLELGFICDQRKSSKILGVIRNGAVIIDVVHLLDALRIVRREPNEYVHTDYRYRPVQ